MGIFDSFVEKNDTIVNNSWIEWNHHHYINYDAMPSIIGDILKTLHKATMMLLGHCSSCIALNACHFAKWNMPKNSVEGDPGLLHPNCHCEAKPISNPIPNKTAFANCPIEKFTGYLFSEKYKYKGKVPLFEIFGYNVNDSAYLKQEYEKQALQKYINGDYELGVLDYYGQRINININLNGYSIITGWMVKPKGLIVNTTPYAAR